MKNSIGLIWICVEYPRPNRCTVDDWNCGVISRRHRRALKRQRRLLTVDGADVDEGG
jgi:hypothetical protein